MNGCLLLLAVVALATADVAGTAEDVTRMIEWALSKGATLHPAVHVGRTPERGRGLFAASSITVKMNRIIR